MVRALLRYGTPLIAEVLVFWLILLAVNASDYGLDTPWPWRPWYPAASLLIVTFAMSAGEATFHLYRRLWSVASLNDAFAIGLAVVEASLLVTIVNLVFPDSYRPLRVLAPVLAAPAIVIAVGLVRLIPRFRRMARSTGNRLLVVIPDVSAYSTVKALVQQSGPDWVPIAIVTATGPVDVGQTLMGIPVMGSTAHLGRWIEHSQAQGIAFVQSNSFARDHLRNLYHQCLAARLPVFILPSTNDWFPHPADSRLRQLTADDLVGRDEHQLDLEIATGEIRNKTVLVTGAAGSIGSELCRLLSAMEPRRLVLVDNNESGLFDLLEELRVAPELDVREALVSIREREHLLTVFADERPDIVFHAAAYKHVPMLESHPGQAVMTNVVGTLNVLRCAHAAGVQKFILISTDKAASRHSIMGCTKRVCEQLVLAYRGGSMSCWAVRFGNVVGSRGSVVPLFERQIGNGGPVTITHRDMCRYMMTIREAASLVLSSLAVSEPGRLYMLDMGEPIRILDLANDLIRSSGLRPEVDIEIVVTGLRPGERMTEELLGPDEGWRPTGHESIREVISPNNLGDDDLAWTIERMEHLARERRTDELVRVLKKVATGQVERPDELESGGDEAAPSDTVRSRESESA